MSVSLNWTAQLNNDPVSSGFSLRAYRRTWELRFNGDIDEVRIFNPALTAVELESIFTSTP